MKRGSEYRDSLPNWERKSTKKETPETSKATELIALEDLFICRVITIGCEFL
jgi:hypothetical protein